jgi:hypothetical protein
MLGLNGELCGVSDNSGKLFGGDIELTSWLPQYLYNFSNLPLFMREFVVGNGSVLNYMHASGLSSGGGDN